MKLYRQGDVLIAEVKSIPADLIEVPLENGRVILAHGEVTGHAHAVQGDVLFLTSDLQELDERFLRVEAEAMVVHEEHATIVLPPGDYVVRRQREYTSADMPPMRVAD